MVEGSPTLQEKIKACEELYHASRVIALTILDKTIRISMGNRNLALMNLSFIRMRLAFELGDPVLIGVAFSSHSSVMMIGGYSSLAEQYSDLARQITDVKSDFLRANVCASDTSRGLWTDLDLTNSYSTEAVALSKHLQLHALWREQIVVKFLGVGIRPRGLYKKGKRKAT